MGYANNDNAFWDPTYKRMTYGDGQSLFDALTSVDVIGHEIGHGVCSSTANLVYQNEPGAINEGLSDIWGSMIEYFAEPTKQTYNIGEDIMLGGGSLRSMSNPNSSLNSQPDTYNGTYWYSGSADHGGVHTNSGVINYWFYLLAEGGSDTNDIGNTFNINGIGKEKASKIVYRAESIYFTSTTNYSQARLLTIQVAKDLYGEASIEAATTCQSWFAVGVGDNNCNLNIEISGLQNICGNSTTTYTLNYTPTSTTWSTSNNLQILSSNANSITVKPISTNINDIATITANINGTIVQKEIWVGKPKITVELEPQGVNYVMVEMVGANGTIIDKQNITSTTWEKVSGSGGCYASFGGSGFIGLGQGNCNSWSIYAKISATNSCGTTIIYRTITPPAPELCDDTLLFDGQNIIIDPCNSINGFNNGTIEIEELKIYKFSGILVYHVKKPPFNISHLEAGIYIVKAKLSNGKIITQKIIK